MNSVDQTIATIICLAIISGVSFYLGYDKGKDTKADSELTSFIDFAAMNISKSLGIPPNIAIRLMSGKVKGKIESVSEDEFKEIMKGRNSDS